MSLCTYVLRRAAAVAAPAATSGARICSVQSKDFFSSASETTASPVFSSVKTLRFAGANAAIATTEPHLCHDICYPPAATLPTAAAASPSRTAIFTSTAPLLSMCQLRLCKGSAGVAFIYSQHIDGEKEDTSRESTSGRRTDAGWSSGFHRSVCGSCRFNIYSSRDNAELCSRSDDSARCGTYASSKSLISKWSERGRNGAMMRPAGRDRSICANNTDNLGFIFRTTASVHEAPMTSAAYGKDDLSDVDLCSTCASPSYHPSLRRPSSSSFSPSAYALRHLRLYTPLGRAVQQQEIRTSAARSAASAQPYTNGAGRGPERDWSTEEEQRFSSVNTSTKAEETASPQRQQREGRVEASNWSFAELRRVPPASVRATGTAGANAAIERTEDADAVPAAKLMRNKSVPGKGSRAREAVAKKDMLPLGSCNRRSSTSERRAPPLLRVTDAAAGRIREIVEMYNREAAAAESPEEATLRNGCRQQEKTSGDSSRISRSNSSSEMQQGENGRRRAIGIRIGLKKRGCSGLSYTVDVATCEEGEEQKFGSASAAGQTSKGLHFPAATSADEVVETKGGTVVLAGDAILFLVGTELDFIDTELERKFVFKNPNEKQACGCGKSFTV